MRDRVYNAVDKWFKSKHVLDILLDVLASVSIGTTIMMSWGDHSFLHELLAFVNYVTCFLLIVLKRPFKYVLMFYILVIFVIAVVTDGFW